jgi:uncharacterized protein (TIRG00374 family)
VTGGFARVWRLLLQHLGWFFGVIAIAVVVVAVSQIGDLETIAIMLRHARAGWLLAALALQAMTYIGVAAGWKVVLDAAGQPTPFRRLYPIAIGKLFADQIVPVAGMGGNMFVVDRLRAVGVKRGAAVAALLVSMTGFYAAYAVCAGAMLGLLWWRGLASILVIIFVVAFLVVALGIPGLAIWIRRRDQRPLSPLLTRFAVVRNLLLIVGEAPKALLADHGLTARAALMNGLVFVADSASLKVCFLALGQNVAFSTAFVGVMTASMIATLGAIPLGLGTFEAGATGMLSLLGVPIENALAATLLLRFFTLWLPLLPGFILIRTALREKAAKLPPPLNAGPGPNGGRAPGLLN